MFDHFTTICMERVKGLDARMKEAAKNLAIKKQIRHALDFGDKIKKNNLGV